MTHRGISFLMFVFILAFGWAVQALIHSGTFQFHADHGAWNGIWKCFVTYVFLVISIGTSLIYYFSAEPLPHRPGPPNIPPPPLPR